MTGGTESNETLANLVKTSGDADGSIRLELLQRNRGFIYNSWKPFSEIIPESDIDGIGFLAITQACQTFNSDRGFFIRWLSWALNRELCRASAEECGSLLSLTGRQEAEIRALHKCKRDFFKLHGREPLEAEICACMGISDDELREIRQAERASYPDSLNRPIAADADGELTLSDTIPDETDLEESCVNRNYLDSLAEFFAEVLRNLPEPQALIIKLRFYSGKSVTNTAKTLNVSVNDVRRGERQAIKTMRMNTGLRRYFETESCFHMTGLTSFKRWAGSQPERIVIQLEERRRPKDEI